MGVHFQQRRRRRRCLATSGTASRHTRSKSGQVCADSTAGPQHHFQQYIVCTVDVEVSCYAYEGIDAVKVALKSGLRQSTEDLPLEIRLIAPPQYVITTTTLDRTEGIAKLNTAIQVSV